MIKSRFSSVLIFSLAAPEAAPMAMRSPVVVKRTILPSSCQPVSSRVIELEMVSFFVRSRGGDGDAGACGKFEGVGIGSCGKRGAADLDSFENLLAGAGIDVVYC